MTSLDWKKLYAAERADIFPSTIDWWLDLDAPPLPELGALVFPHTYLLKAVEQIVPAVLSVLRARVSDVLALGPLHGGRVADAEIVKRARAGDAQAISAVRGVHSGDSDIASEEFCLDAFEWLVAELSRRMDIKPPAVHRRHPFLVGDDPASVPGMRRLHDLVRRGAAVVATADPVHHGREYGTPEPDLRDRADPAAAIWAMGEVERGFALLDAQDYVGFKKHAADVKSDFRDVGPVLRELLPGRWTATVESMALVDYAHMPGSTAPSWVAAPLSRVDVADATSA